MSCDPAHVATELVKPVDEIFKTVGVAPTQIISPADLDQTEQLAGALNEVFDTVEAQWQAEAERKRAKTTAARHSTAAQAAAGSGAESFPSTEGAEEPSTPAENATSHAEGQNDQQAHTTIPSSFDSTPSTSNSVPTRLGTATAATDPASFHCSPAQATAAGIPSSVFSFGGFNSNAAGSSTTSTTPAPVSAATTPPYSQSS